LVRFIEEVKTNVVKLFEVPKSASFFSPEEPVQYSTPVASHKHVSLNHNSKGQFPDLQISFQYSRFCWHLQIISSGVYHIAWLFTSHPLQYPEVFRNIYGLLILNIARSRYVALSQ
jgi:hypothetical protein